VSTITKVFVVLTAVLSIIASVLFVSAAAQWHNWRELAASNQIARDAAIAERDRLYGTLHAALAMKDDTIRNRDRLLADANATVQTLTDDKARMQSELVQTRNDKVAFEASTTRLQEILSVVTAEVTGLRGQNQELFLQNIAYQNEIAGLNDRVLGLTANTTILTEQVRNLQEKIFAYERQIADMQERLAAAPAVTTVVAERKPRVAPSVAGPIRGEIKDVSGPYASINIGASSGVVDGMVMMVYRGTTFLGELEVGQVYPDEAGGRLRTVQGEIQVGDRVAFDEQS